MRGAECIGGHPPTIKHHAAGQGGIFPRIDRTAKILKDSWVFVIFTFNYIFCHSLDDVIYVMWRLCSSSEIEQSCDGDVMTQRLEHRQHHTNSSGTLMTQGIKSVHLSALFLLMFFLNNVVMLD